MRTVVRPLCSMEFLLSYLPANMPVASHQKGVDRLVSLSARLFDDAFDLGQQFSVWSVVNNIFHLGFHYERTSIFPVTASEMMRWRSSFIYSISLVFSVISLSIFEVLSWR